MNALFMRNVFRNFLVLNLKLDQNYPNPFNPSTNISFSVGTFSHTSLRVFDVLGREVATVFSGTLSAGSYTKQWNAEGSPSGVYFYHLQAGPLSETKKLLLLKVIPRSSRFLSSEKAGVHCDRKEIKS